MDDDENDQLGELKGLLNDMVSEGLPVTKSKISAVAECALRNAHKYKKVVYAIERFIRHSEVAYRSAGICVIDSLCTKARKSLGKEKDVFTPRFAIRMSDTVATLKNVSRSDKALLNRIFGEWRKRGWFDVPSLSSSHHSSHHDKHSSSSKGHSPDVDAQSGGGSRWEVEGSGSTLDGEDEEAARIRREALLREQQAELERRQQEMMAEQEAKRREAEEQFQSLLKKAPLPPPAMGGAPMAPIPPPMPPASAGAAPLDPRKRAAAAAAASSSSSGSVDRPPAAVDPRMGSKRPRDPEPLSSPESDPLNDAPPSLAYGSSSTSEAAPPSSSSSSSRRSKTKLCRYYRTGCPYGDQCRLAHDPSELTVSARSGRSKASRWDEDEVKPPPVVTEEAADEADDPIFMAVDDDEEEDDERREEGSGGIGGPGANKGEGGAAPDAASLESARTLLSDFLTAFQGTSTEGSSSSSSKATAGVVNCWPAKIPDRMRSSEGDNSQSSYLAEDDEEGGMVPGGFVVGVAGMALQWTKRKGLLNEARGANNHNRPASRTGGVVVAGAGAASGAGSASGGSGGAASSTTGGWGGGWGGRAKAATAT